MRHVYFFSSYIASARNVLPLQPVRLPGHLRDTSRRDPAIVEIEKRASGYGIVDRLIVPTGGAHLFHVLSGDGRQILFRNPGQVNRSKAFSLGSSGDFFEIAEHAPYKFCRAAEQIGCRSGMCLRCRTRHSF